MSEISMFFNALELHSDSGVVTYDRTYDASDFARYFASFIGNGVFANPSSNLQILAKSGLTITVKPGKAFIDGYFYELTEEKTLTIGANTSGVARNDKIVCVLKKGDRKITVEAVQGASKLTPDNDGSRHELVLATISLGAGVGTITNAMITDRRPYNSYCGWVTGVINQINTSSLFAQYDAEFKEWFNSVKTELSGDVAAQLSSRVSALESALNELKTTVNAMPTIRSGASTPSDSLGKNGDVYIKTLS